MDGPLTNRARGGLDADEPAWNRVLRKRSWRSVTAAVLWLLVLISAVLGMVGADASADSLLVRRGARGRPGGRGDGSGA
ncbi:hypothetical protein ACWEOE_12150 [Amycolatopsis sp. NPDC004368]